MNMDNARLQRIPQHMAPQKGEIRLFESRILERLSRISPRTVLLVYLPLIMFSVWKNFAVGVNTSTFGLLVLSGLVFWTLFEYTLHRFVFHYSPRGVFQERLVFLFHGVHHQYPNDKDRLVMPVALSLLITFLIFLVFYAIFDEHVWGFFAGFMAGYLGYDMTHYSIHHVRIPQNPWLKKRWKHHLDHHFRDTSSGYGVSSSVWDRVFGTLQKQNKVQK